MKDYMRKYRKFQHGLDEISSELSTELSNSSSFDSENASVLDSSSNCRENSAVDSDTSPSSESDSELNGLLDNGNDVDELSCSCRSVSDVNDTCSSGNDVGNMSITGSELSDLRYANAMPVWSFLDKMAAWAVKNNVTRDGVNGMLRIFRQSGYFHHKDIPKDARMLIRTPQEVNAIEKCGGKYIYLGVKAGLLEMSTKFESLGCTVKCIQLDCNIDGLPLQKSNKYQFWPILCSICNVKSCPFVVALYGGTSKPKNLEEFLTDLVSELSDLITNGFVINDLHYAVKFRAFVCDAPARAFVKSIASHTAKHACERCTTVGVYTDRRVVFINDVAAKRTDVDFRANQYPHHKYASSPILLIPGLDVVQSFVLDSMHLLYLGVCRRFLTFLKSGPNIKLSNGQLQVMSDRLITIAKYTPSEFVRRHRSIFELEKWKATELRQFILYTGLIVMEGIVSNDLYQLFLSLSVAVRILNLSDRDERIRLLPFARQLLTAFVHNGRILCGDCFATYNVHNLLHVCDDVAYYDCALDELSSFQYENYLQYLKRTIADATKNPLVSAVKRLQERSNTMQVGYEAKSVSKVSAIRRDQYFVNKEEQVCEVVETISNGKHKQYSCRVISKRYLKAYFSTPLNSKEIGISECKYNSAKWKPRLLTASDVVCKVYAIQNARSALVFFSLLQSVDCKCTLNQFVHIAIYENNLIKLIDWSVIDTLDVLKLYCRFSNSNYWSNLF